MSAHAEALGPEAHTEAATPQPQPKKPQDGREANGRFARGNHGGPGNPFARKTAALRQALLDAVTEQDIREIVPVLLLKAKTGDLTAVKLLFSYVIGRPTEAPNPDRLNVEEWKLLQESVLTDEQEMGKPACGVPLEPWLVTSRAAAQVQETKLCAQFLEGLGYPEQAQAIMQEQLGVPEAPSPNGANGGSAPSANRANGGSAPSPSGSNGDRPAAGQPRPPKGNGENRPRDGQDPPSTNRESGTVGTRPRPNPLRVVSAWRPLQELFGIVPADQPASSPKGDIGAAARGEPPRENGGNRPASRSAPKPNGPNGDAT